MTLLEAIQNRHSIRRYKKMPLADDVVSKIQQKVDELNILGNLNMQLVTFVWLYTNRPWYCQVPL